MNAQRWIALICGRDELGLRRLYNPFGCRMQRGAITIVRRDEVAHEVVSASLMQVWTTAAGCDTGRGPAVSWLMLIARSRSYDALRRMKLTRDWEVSLDDDDAFALFRVAPSTEPAWQHEQLGTRQRLTRALDGLSPRQRQVVTLTLMDGLSHDEVSRHLDLPLEPSSRTQ